MDADPVPFAETGVLARAYLQIALSAEGRRLAESLPVQRPFYLDTLAVCHAARGEYDQALALEREALAALPESHDSRPGYAVRVARFAALAAAGPEERPARVLDSPPLTSAAARDALFRAFDAEREPRVREEIVRLLRSCFATDPSAGRVPAPAEKP